MKRINISILSILLLLTIFSCDTVEPDSEEWDEIQECIMGVAVDYESHMRIRNAEDVEEVFNQFIDYSKENDYDVFGYGSNWRFDDASKHGLYEGTKYWKVSASWFSKQDSAWHQKNVFDVSEGGEVVRLLGCI